MEYNFYTIDGVDMLRITGDEHTDYQQEYYLITVTKTSLETTTDQCMIHEKIESGTDADGKAYDIYTIVDHIRKKDRTEQHEYKISLTEDALCEEDETLDERLAIIEDVLCELDERINGGE